ncbi:Imm50 family immunity protein [Mesobacillus selenatarsenatis]|uniref:Imm50 family immunity protein n=1 Tax=Mesobacillus selenatarsenatis TaxID=388741 RepID=UPI0005A73FFE|nr:Imm50 family immunity protein [Mesobacillus selenatarsenatis]
MWYEHFTDNKFISMIYTKVPTLKNLRIEKIEISREGDRLTVGFDLPFFADKPPKKWIEGRYTTTFVELDFFDIQEVSIKASSNTYRGDIDICKDEQTDLLIVNITGTVEAKIIAGSGIIQTVNGY